MHKPLFLSIAITLTMTAFQPGNLFAGPAQSYANQNIPQEAWLGVALNRIPTILRSQLGSVIPAQQGVMITSVANNSPAQKAGLQQYDVILRADDQKIFSANQLTGLIRAAPPKSSMHLAIVRQSAVKDIVVTLGQREKPAYPAWHQQWPQYRQRMPDFAIPNFQNNGPSAMSWDSFESVQVNTLPDGRYHAEVKYKDPQGNQKNFSFEGKREEIIDQINQQKELSPAKKQALLNALNMDPNAVFSRPFFQGNNPFDDPFFRQNFRGLNMPDIQQFFQNHRQNYRSMPQSYPPGEVL